MGNDGGYIATRVDLVKNKEKEIKIDNLIVAKNKATLCQLSKERLKKPIVICRLGNLYNYEALLTHMMNKTLPDDFKHIKKIKNDIKTVKMTENKEEDSQNPFMCPLSKIEFNGMNKFAALWSCGCVFSQQLIENVKGNTHCPCCGEKYSKSDIVSLNLNDQEQNDLFHKIIQANKKKDKKQEKKSKNQEEQEEEKQLEPLIKKQQKIEKKEIQQPKLSLIQKLTEQEMNKNKEGSLYKSLFHKSGEHKDDYENLMFRNTRHGVR